MGKKVILIHGNGGATGRHHWFPSVQDALTTSGIDCLAPDMPDPVLARSQYWLPYLESLGCDGETVLVGHSSGAIAAMRHAEQHRILGSVLVGTYYTDLGAEDEKQSGYFDTAWNWRAIKDNQQWVTIYASTDDPFISIAEQRFVRDNLSAEYYEFTDRGHFSGGDRNETEFPEIVELLQKKLSE